MTCKLTNNAWATLAVAINASDTSIVLTAGQGARFDALAGTDYCYATLLDAGLNLEVVKVTGRASDTLTVQRGQDGFAGRSYAIGDRIEVRVCSAAIRAIAQEATQVVDATGTDSYTSTLSPVPEALNTSQVYAIKPQNTNTVTNPTWNPSGFGAKTIKRMDGSACRVGDLVGGGVALLFYNGADMLLLNPAAEAPRAGEVVFWPGVTLPTTAYECDGTAKTRAGDASLFGKLVKSATFTMSLATPAVVTAVAHGLGNFFPVKFSTSGALPTGVIAGRRYWTKNVAADTFEFSLTPGGTSINSSGSQSGTHTFVCAPAGDGDGSTTFNVPDMRNRAPIGYGAGTVTESFLNTDVDTAADACAILDNIVKWVTGMQVVFTTSGGAPGGLSNGGTFFVIRNGTGSIKFASTLANAQNNVPIDITTQGTGTHTITHTRAVRGLGEDGGEEAHAMSGSELLAHTHVEQHNPTDGLGVLSYAQFLGGTDDSDPTRVGVNDSGGVITTQSTGGNAAANLMSPFGAGRWIIYRQ